MTYPERSDYCNAVDALSTAEIVLLLIIDATWTLPAGSRDRFGRMAAAMALVDAEKVKVAA